DARGGEFERLAQPWLERGEGRMAGFRTDAPAVLVCQAIAVAARGHLRQRIVSLVAHLGEDVAHRTRGIGLALAPVVDDAGELDLEIPVAGFQPEHQAASAAVSARKVSTSATTRGSGLSAARLTISRA